MILLQSDYQVEYKGEKRTVDVWVKTLDSTDISDYEYVYVEGEERITVKFEEGNSGDWSFPLLEFLVLDPNKGVWGMSIGETLKELYTNMITQQLAFNAIPRIRLNAPSWEGTKYPKPKKARNKGRKF